MQILVWLYPATADALADRCERALRTTHPPGKPLHTAKHLACE